MEVPASSTTNNGVKETVSSVCLSSSTWITSPGLTLACFPPVRMMAYMDKPLGKKGNERSIRPLRSQLKAGSGRSQMPGTPNPTPAVKPPYSMSSGVTETGMPRVAASS